MIQQIYAVKEQRPQLRTCYACGSTKTTIRKDKGHYGKEAWGLNHDNENNVICHPCLLKYFYPKRPSRNEYRRRFIKPKYLFSNGRHYYYPWLQRIGICNFCCAVKDVNCKRTNWHHQKGFFRIFPWYGIIELCNSCHSKEKWILGECHKDQWRQKK